MIRLDLMSKVWMTPSSLPGTKHGFVFCSRIARAVNFEFRLITELYLVEFIFYVSLISIRSPTYVLKYSALP